MNIDKVIELRDALKEIVDAAFNCNGWADVDPLFERQKKALKAIEEEIDMYNRIYKVQNYVKVFRSDGRVIDMQIGPEITGWKKNEP